MKTPLFYIYFFFIVSSNGGKLYHRTGSPNKLWELKASMSYFIRLSSGIQKNYFYCYYFIFFFKQIRPSWFVFLGTIDNALFCFSLKFLVAKTL